MPRDIFTSDSKDNSLVASPVPATPRQDATTDDGYQEFTIHRDERTEPGAHQFLGGQQPKAEKDNLHPYVQTLSLSNLESCVALENAVFPDQERCSREKVDMYFYTISYDSILSKASVRERYLFPSQLSIYVVHSI